MPMDEREVRSRGDALQKALSSRETTENILGILKELQKGVKPSEDLLRKTQIGKIVNKVKGLQGVDPAVPRLAAEIISQWRNSVNKKPAPPSGSTTPNGQKSPAPTSTTTATSHPKSDSKLPTGVPLDKRTWKTDKIDKGSITSEAGRNNSIGLLYDGMVSGSSLPASEVLSTARAVEQTIYNLPVTDSNASGAAHTTDAYKEKIRSLYQNLKANPDLRTRLLSGQVSPQKFATMTHDEMKSKEQRAADEKIKKANMSDAMAPKDEESVSDHLECGRCKKKMVSFTQAQTRSADEPMTTFCKCLNCGNRWKFS